MTVATNPNAILIGGPAAGLPETDRIRSVAVSDTNLKVLHGNRYEHFRRTAEVVQHELGELSVFSWTGVTYVAE